jgi:PAS domain S-box-containing protein
MLASDFRRVEEALRENEQRFRVLFELGPVAVYSCDVSGVIREFNQRAVQLWGREPKLGDTDERFCGSFKMVRPDGSVMVHAECPMAEVLSGSIPETHDAEVLIERPDGSCITVIVNIRPLKNEHGEVTGAINCFHDITERKRTEELLREADLRKNEFLAMLAHELRNPLAPIRNAVQILRMKGADAEAVLSASEMMERQVGQMVRLVDDLLDVTRITRGKIELRKGRIELASAVHHAVEAARSLVEHMGHDLTVTLSPRPIFLHADPTRLAQVVGNLLNNACKFTDRGGRIWLTVEQEDEQAVIRVRDNGIGIATEQRFRIFDMFVQVDTSLERSTSGLGIGLSLVKNLVEMHGGTVGVHSAGVGQGSEFVVRLPIMVETPKLLPPEPTARMTAMGRRILVVDDNRDSATSLAMLLTLTGNETHTAYDGLEAVEAAATAKPDVVLMDIGLPKLNGYEACRRIREQPWGKNMVLVALTGWGQEDDRQKSKEVGFNAHMVKPVDLPSLMDLLAELPTASA